MFDPASHLWLRDKSVSVTQLKPSVRANCGSVKAFNCFSFSVRRKRDTGRLQSRSQQYFWKNIYIYKPYEIFRSDNDLVMVNKEFKVKHCRNEKRIVC